MGKNKQLYSLPPFRFAVYMIIAPEFELASLWRQ